MHRGQTCTQCDEATGRGRRMCAEKNIRHCVVGRKEIVARLEARRTADCTSVRHGGSQKPRPRGVGEMGTMQRAKMSMEGLGSGKEESRRTLVRENKWRRTTCQSGSANLKSTKAGACQLVAWSYHAETHAVSGAA